MPPGPPWLRRKALRRCNLFLRPTVPPVAPSAFTPGGSGLSVAIATYDPETGRHPDGTVARQADVVTGSARQSGPISCRPDEPGFGQPTWTSLNGMVMMIARLRPQAPLGPVVASADQSARRRICGVAVWRHPLEPEDLEAIRRRSVRARYPLRHNMFDVPPTAGLVDRRGPALSLVTEPVHSVG